MSEKSELVQEIERQARICDVSPETYAYWLGFFERDFTRTTVELLTR